MAGEWASMVFTDAVQVNPSVPLRKGQKYPFVEMQAVEPSWRDVSESERRVFTSSGARFMSGDTLMARITPCLENGKIARYRPCCGGNEPAFGSTEFIVIRGRDGVTDNDYVYYLTNWQEFRHFAVSQMTGSSGRQRVPASALENFLVPVPPLAEQHAIAHILGTLDDKIELNRRMNRTLEEMARAIFRSWFVDFDPVRAKMEGRWKKGESLPGLPADLWDVFPDRLVSSELGEIPERWEVGALGDIIEIHDSKRIPLSSRERAKRQGPYRYYGAAGIVDYVDDFLFDGIHVLVGEDGSVMTDIGNPLVQYVWGKFWVNNHAHVLKASSGISDEHLLLLLQQVYVVPFVTGAVQPKLSQTNMTAIPVVRAKPEVNAAFNKLIEPIFAKVRALHDEVSLLAAIRDTLLPKLLSGELQVPDAKRIAGGSI